MPNFQGLSKQLKPAPNVIWHKFNTNVYSGSHSSPLSLSAQITANLDVFLRRFNEVQYWIVTELVSTPSLSKRVGLVRKFIKLAA